MFQCSTLTSTSYFVVQIFQLIVVDVVGGSVTCTPLSFQLLACPREFSTFAGTELFELSISPTPNLRGKPDKKTHHHGTRSLIHLQALHHKMKTSCNIATPVFTTPRHTSQPQEIMC